MKLLEYRSVNACKIWTFLISIAINCYNICFPALKEFFYLFFGYLNICCVFRIPKPWRRERACGAIHGFSQHQQWHVRHVGLHRDLVCILPQLLRRAGRDLVSRNTIQQWISSLTWDY